MKLLNSSELRNRQERIEREKRERKRAYAEYLLEKEKRSAEKHAKKHEELKNAQYAKLEPLLDNAFDLQMRRVLKRRNLKRKGNRLYALKAQPRRRSNHRAGYSPPANKKCSNANSKTPTCTFKYANGAPCCNKVVRYMAIVDNGGQIDTKNGGQLTKRKIIKKSDLCWIHFTKKYARNIDEYLDSARKRKIPIVKALSYKFKKITSDKNFGVYWEGNKYLLRVPKNAPVGRILKDPIRVK